MSVKQTLSRKTPQGSITGLTKATRVGFVGASFGKDSLVSNYEANLALVDGTSDTLSDIVSIKSISKVALNQNDNFNVFIEDKDYSFTAPNIIVWLNNPIAPPELEGSVVDTGGSGLGTAAFNYKITVKDQNGEESLLSNLITLQGSNANVSHKLNWVKPLFATGYNIYDSTANSLVASITSGDTVEYIRTSNASSPATLPSVNKARKVPAYGGSYYVDYILTSYDYTVKNYTDLAQVQSDHGIGSDITNLARFGFKYVKVPEMYICATDGTNASAFTDAIDKLSAIKDITNIAALKDSTSVEEYLVSTAVNDSKDSIGKEKFAFVAPSNSLTSVGNTSTPGTIRYWLASWLNGGTGVMNLIAPIINGNKIYADLWQEINGSFTENKLIPNHFLAGIIAFMAANTDDVATSLVGVQVPGINFGPNGAPWNDEVEKDKISGEGGMYIFNNSGQPTIYDDNTNDTSILENFQRPIPNAEYELRRRLRVNTKRYMGKKITTGLLSAVKITIKKTLEDAQSDQIIAGFEEDITVLQDSSILNKVNCDFVYTNIYTLTNLNMTYGFKVAA